jgi:tRNA nucleotidyltransferase/poly(A) polymerase
LVVDVAHFRGETLAADLADRDFTVNALAADVRAPGDVIDHHKGMADLAARLIRPVSEHSIRDDPLRALRALRQAAELGFTLAPETETLICRDGLALSSVSGERVRDELARLLAHPHAAPFLRRMDDLGLLTAVLPELEPLRGLKQPPPHHLDVLSHSLETVDALEQLLDGAPAAGSKQQAASQAPILRLRSGQVSQFPNFLAPFADRLEVHLAATLGGERPRLVTLKLAALLHDVGKPAARMLDDQERIRFLGHDQRSAKLAGAALRRLRFNRVEVRLGETVVRHHMRPLLLANQPSVSSRSVYRFFRDTGDAGVDVLLHALADHRATYAPGATDGTSADDPWPRLVALTARMLADYYERGEQRVAPPPLLTGHDLLREFGLEPGPQIGELLEAVREAQVSGEVSSREGALTLVRARLDTGDQTVRQGGG